MTNTLRRISLEFLDNTRGAKLRSTEHVKELRDRDGLGLQIGRAVVNNEYWTPFQYEQVTLETLAGKKHEHKNDDPARRLCISRVQFLMVECEAMTIHKSQSSTMPKVCVRLTNSLTNQLLYTGLSRCKSLDGLYLILDEGATSFRPYTVTNNRLNNAIRLNANNKNNLEMERLRRDAPFKNVFAFAEADYECESEFKSLSVMSLDMCANPLNFDERLSAIQCDFGFRHADLVFLTGCGSAENSERTLQYQHRGNDYKVFDNKCTEPGLPFGSICLVRKHLQDRLQQIYHSDNRHGKSDYELSVYKFMLVGKIKENPPLYFCSVHILNQNKPVETVKKVIYLILNLK